MSSLKWLAPLNLILFPSLLIGCAPLSQGSEHDLPLGDVVDDVKADGTWGSALQCKKGPDLPSLEQPHITISLDGLTLHLVDTSTGFDKVYPIGPGAIDHHPGELTTDESLSYEPVLRTGSHDFAIDSNDIDPCKTWWTDPASGQRSPVFAGLPFMPWHGNYAIHGPIDNYRAPNGGTLRRGFVSHGCVRMEAADILEVYARIRRVRSTPVHVQREPELDPQHRRIDIPNVWLGADCTTDADCNFKDGFCRPNRYSGRGVCAAHCTSLCADRTGYPGSFCIADPDDQTSGICVNKLVEQNWKCRPYDDQIEVEAKRFGQEGVTATVCVPGSPAWIGDPCFADQDCSQGAHCSSQGGNRGVCTTSCTNHVCPDQAGSPSTFCALDASGMSSCVRRCTPASNASECPAGFDCVAQSRANGSSEDNFACVLSAT